MASPRELRDQAEQATVFTASRSIAASLIRQTIAKTLQPTLSPGLMTVQERRIYLAQLTNPGTLFVSSKQMSELRLEACIAASDLDIETVAAAPHGSVVIDQANGPMDWPGLGVSIGIPTDPLLGSYVARPSNLESVLSMDYASIAQKRLASPLGRHGLLHEKVLPVEEGEF